MSSPYPLPLIFTAWGFRRSADAWNGAQFLADRCKAAGIKAVAVQLGFDDQVTKEFWTKREEADKLRENGLRVVVWGVADFNTARAELTRLGARDEDWFPQVEGPGQRDAVLDASRQGLHPTAIVTNYGGAGGESPADVGALRAAGVKAVFVEVYSELGWPHTDANHMLWAGTTMGWKPEELYALFATYREEMPTTYTGTSFVGRKWGLYLSEPMSGGQWNTWGGWMPIPPPPAPPPPKPTGPTSAQARANIVKEVKSWQATLTQPAPNARLTVTGRITGDSSTNERWNSVRERIVKILNDAGFAQ